MTKAKNCKPAADYRTDTPREDGWTYQRQAAFLMTLAQTGLVSQACAVAEMSPTARDCVSAWLAGSPPDRAGSA
jgi:hypothetical protein